MPRFRTLLLSCLALAVIGDFAWNFWQGDPGQLLKSRDLRALPALQPGDLLLAGKAGVSGNLMRLAAKTPWTHVALVVSADPEQAAVPEKVPGALLVKQKISTARRFAADAEAFAVARIANCTQQCRDAVVFASQNLEKPEKIELGADGFGEFSGSFFIARAFSLPVADLGKSADGQKVPVLPENILSRLNASIIFSTVRK